jgi:hypothetical protein
VGKRPVLKKKGGINVKRVFIFLLMIFIGYFLAYAAGDKITVGNMPPSVIKTVPQAGDTDVDPSLREIRATFSKEMLTENQWSWCQYTKETFPKVDKKGIRFMEDKRTCVLPVELKPGKTYVIWINSEKWNYFKDKNGCSAIPYLLVFQTRK